MDLKSTDDKPANPTGRSPTPLDEAMISTPDLDLDHADTKDDALDIPATPPKLTVCQQLEQDLQILKTLDSIEFEVIGLNDNNWIITRNEVKKHRLSGDKFKLIKDAIAPPQMKMEKGNYIPGC